MFISVNGDWQAAPGGGLEIGVWGGWAVGGNENWLAACRVKDQLQQNLTGNTTVLE